MPDIYDFDGEYDPDEEIEVEPDYDAINDDRLIELWEASRPPMLIQSTDCEPF